MFYFIVFCIILFFATLDYNKNLNQQSRDLAFFILFMAFWLIAGLRYETGVDWPYYDSYFRDIRLIPVLRDALNLKFYDQYEFGYILLNAVLRVVTPNVQWLWILIAFVTNLLLFSSIRKYSGHIFLSLLLYFTTIYFILDMSGIRQCIALNIFLFSLRYVQRRQFSEYLLLILVAALFHMTSLMLIPVYFILKTEFKSRVLVIFVFAGVLISILQVEWIDFFLDRVSGYIGMEAITNKIYRYSMRSDARVYGIGFILNLLIFLFIIYKRKELADQKMFNIFLNIYVAGLFFYYFTWELNEFSSRLRLYFLAGNIVLFTQFFDVFRRKLNRSIVFLFIVFYSLFYGRTYLFGLPEALAYTPYQNYVVHKVFGLKSTGHERLEEFISSQESND
jgi:hypothetical protein